MHTVIVANAPGFDAAPFRTLLARADLLIAADGGGNALFAAGVAPQLVVGDLDSLEAAAEAAFAGAGVEIRRHPAEKDETDLELALLVAIRHGATSIDLLGAMDGRWDQAFANVGLLALPSCEEGLDKNLSGQRRAHRIAGHADHRSWRPAIF